jgi:hypothetical protein
MRTNEWEKTPLRLEHCIGRETEDVRVRPACVISLCQRRVVDPFRDAVSARAKTQPEVAEPVLH